LAERRQGQGFHIRILAGGGRDKHGPPVGVFFSRGRKRFRPRI
jgi:hypothetical protein